MTFLAIFKMNFFSIITYLNSSFWIHWFLELTLSKYLKLKKLPGTMEPRPKRYFRVSYFFFLNLEAIVSQKNKETNLDSYNQLFFKLGLHSFLWTSGECGLLSQLCHWLAVWPRGSCLNSLGCSCFIVKGIIIIPPTQGFSRVLRQMSCCAFVCMPGNRG